MFTEYLLGARLLYTLTCICFETSQHLSEGGQDDAHFTTEETDTGRLKDLPELLPLVHDETPDDGREPPTLCVQTSRAVN